MYIPLKSTLLRLLPLPLQSLLGSYGPATQSIVPEDQLRPPHGHERHRLGNLSPYDGAPLFPGVSAHLPDDCTVDQVILLHRHGSRGPVEEQAYILKLVDTLNRAQDIIRQADLPPSLEFLRQGYKYELVPEELTIIGHRELFEHGIQFGFRYPTFTTDTVVSTPVQRVIDSSHFFSQGFFGREAEKNITHLTTKDFPDPVSWLRPWKSCPKLSYDEPAHAAQKWGEQYIPSIVDRLNALIPGVGFTFNDIQGALYACPYDLATRYDSPWCNVFTEHELRSFEYQLDVFFDHFTGHASTNPGPVVGAFYIKKLISRLTDENAQPLYLDFAHDFTILLPLATMGLNKDAYPLSPTHLFRQRKFRTTYQTPFAAEMVWERFTCQASFEGPQVRLLLNGATFPLSICQESGDDGKYGTCSLDNFVSANAFSLGVEYHSDFWNATCERD